MSLDINYHCWERIHLQFLPYKYSLLGGTLSHKTVAVSLTSDIRPSYFQRGSFEYALIWCITKLRSDPCHVGKLFFSVHVTFWRREPNLVSYVRSCACKAYFLYISPVLYWTLRASSVRNKERWSTIGEVTETRNRPNFRVRRWCSSRKDSQD